MRVLNNLTCIGCALLLAIPAFTSKAAAADNPSEVQQTQGDKTVTGVVTDSKGFPVPGAFVAIVGNNTTGAMTDSDGKFTIKAPEGATLSVQCMGYVTYEVAVSRATNLNIRLQDDLQSLEESVVVGYGTQRKSNLTAAISTINSKSIAATTNSDVGLQLQGRVSGLNIRSNTGEPGSFDRNINVRGLGTPLFIIDGIQRTSTDFNRLNSEDIESISVLKDASAAIYGLNASNGVVIVTTHKGHDGKTRFQFNANVGFSSPTDQVKMANAYEYWVMRNRAAINKEGIEAISPDELAMWKAGGEGYESTDWYGEVMKKSTLRQEYSITADGGNDKVRYYFNVNHINDDGMLKSGDLYYKKISFRSNVTAQLLRDLEARVAVSAYTDKKTAPYSGFFNIWRGTVTMLPYQPVYANNTPPYLNDLRDGQSNNPVGLMYEDNVGYNRSTNTALNTNFELSWKPYFAPGLELKGVVAYDRLFNHGKSLRNNWKMWNYDAASDTYTASDYQSQIQMGSSYHNYQYVTTQWMANYNKTFAEAHNFGASLIFETRSSAQDWDGISKYFDFYANDQLDFTSDDKAVSTGNESKTRNLSFIGRVNYDYKGRYLLEAVVRRDGSYRYHPDVRWGTFPVVSAGWRVSEEPFMKNIGWLSNLKLRASYGVVGQDEGAAFQYLAAFKSTGGGWWEFSDGKILEGVATPALVNEKLSWTKNKLADLGIDLGFLDNRLSITFDVFRRNRTGLLAYRNASLPNTYGASFPQENLNSNRTQGIEISASWQDRIGEFFYSISGNYTFARTMNRYVERGDYISQWNEYRNGGDYRWSGLTWLFKADGQFKNEEEILNYPVYSTTLGNKYMLPGDWKIEDTNGDGVIDGDDVRPIGLQNGGTPLMNYGLTLSGQWKGLDFNILFQGAALFNTYHSLSYTIPFWENGNIPSYYMDSWHHADEYDPTSAWVPGEFPAIREGANKGYNESFESTQNYLDCSYLRLKNIEIGYTINQPFIRKAGLQSVRVFVSGHNLLTFCNKYVKAYDPETIAGSANTGWVYPLMRTFNVGVNVNF